MLRRRDGARARARACATPGRCARRGRCARGCRAERAADHRPAHPRHAVPGGARRHARRMPGGFGTGKTVLQEALRQVVRRRRDRLRRLRRARQRDGRGARRVPAPRATRAPAGRSMERTVIIANTSNMPVAAREASIYTAITVAEYFRDQGLHVALMADSTSRWAEALREVSGPPRRAAGRGRLPGLPELAAGRVLRARRARRRRSAAREGSVTIIGAVSPPAGDFSEPVTLHTKRYVRCFWALDRQRAQARFYPAIHPLQSYSADADALRRLVEALRQPRLAARSASACSTLLEQQAHLERMARIVGTRRAAARSSS
ncbi:MAG: hypothetical protein MZV65_31410 [Chromatiales bacterium]|nr:hypothetical protein [Chromatiales bacterium]